MSMHPTRNLIAEFKRGNRVFIETGSFRGDGIQLAIDAGYEHIVSIEIEPVNIAFCYSRFDLGNHHQLPQIVLKHGDSADDLARIVNDFDEPITFWLDSHWQMLEDTDPGKNPFPLYNELRQIANHRRNDHTILIDDWLYMTHPDITGWTEAQIKAMILRINDQYQVRKFANPVINNLLVAHL